MESPRDGRNPSTTAGSSYRGAFSWTWGYISHRPAPFIGGWWGIADAIGHRLRLPRVLMRPICDRYEIAVGVPKADLIEMDYAGKAPWWLR